MQIGTVTSSPSLGTIKPPVQRGAVKQLGQALRSGDLEAAQKAYATLSSEAPNLTVRKPDGGFAQLGNDLAAGNLDAAKSTFSSMVKGSFQKHAANSPALPPVPAPQTSSSGGPMGELISVTV